MKRPCNIDGNEAVTALVSFLYLLAVVLFFYAMFAIGARMDSP